MTETVAAPHLKLALEQSDPVAYPGTRVTLTTELRLPPDMHVYAPGAQGYKPIKLVIEAIPQMEFKPSEYPPSKILYLPAIKQSIPVFEGTFRITEDVKVNSGSRGKSSHYPEPLSIRLATEPCVIYQHLSPSNGNYRYFRWTAPEPPRTFVTNSAVRKPGHVTKRIRTALFPLPGCDSMIVLSRFSHLTAFLTRKPRHLPQSVCNLTWWHARPYNI